MAAHPTRRSAGCCPTWTTRRSPGPRRGKPDPEGYLLAARSLGVDPAECTVLEDAPAGIEAGRAAGMHVVGITTTHDPRELPAHELAPSIAAWLHSDGE